MRRTRAIRNEGPDGPGRIEARPGRGGDVSLTGIRRIPIEARSEVLLSVPAGYLPGTTAPLALMLHGAGGNAEGGLRPLVPLADAAGLFLLSVGSRGQTWDVLLGDFGPDVRAIDQALEATFSQYAIDPSHLAIGGFSDGASYALSLGITNGDLFSHIIAFSPGFMAPAAQVGMPKVFISHGTDDRTLPIDVCSRRIVPQLERAGYDVRYEEFDGPHTVPPDVAMDAVLWFLGPRGGRTE